MKTFSQNQMMLKLVEFRETNSRPKLQRQNKRQKNHQRKTNNLLRKKVNVVNNKKNQQIRKMKNQRKKIVRKIRKTEIDYSKKRVRKEVLDEMRYNYLKSVRKYMNQKLN